MAALLLVSLSQVASQSVPTEIQLPGTQPLEVPDLTPPTQCDNCHAGYDAAVEPAHIWRGSLMSQASRDPLFWASVAIAEQDFAGSGDLCLRCHVPDGWLAGRSLPTNGSGFVDQDATSVSCHLCHRMVNPDGSEHPPVQNEPFVAHDGETPPEAFVGNGMFTLLYDDVRLGPYDDSASPHAFAKSQFHRSPEACGTCHDVSNPATGDLAHNNGAQVPLQPGTFSGVLGSPVETKAAFNNPPYAYGVVERTFSEHMVSAFPELPVSAYASLPLELQAGAIEEAWTAAMASTQTGDYVDGDPRTFTCQTCHMPPVTGKGAKQNQAPVRSDLPLHDQTGGNYWMPDVLAYYDQQELFTLGGGLSADELAGLAEGKQRALHTLSVAASLELSGNDLRVINLTGHKLITGYPEGRRMWLRTRWLGPTGQLLREDGAYGPVPVTVGGNPTTVDTLLDLHDPNARVYEAHFGMTQEWAAQLLGLGTPAGLPLTYDRVDGAVTSTLGELAAQPPGTAWETFHFVLNNTILADNRIPPYGMEFEEAEEHNVLPVPADQYGAPSGHELYRYWDELTLVPPPGAASATIELLYQPTSWEYVQFLLLANTGADPFLATVGQDLYDAWRATGMAAPAVMATVDWTAPFTDCNENGVADATDIASGTSQDCNANGIPDECDIAGGASLDQDLNGVPDECQPVVYCGAKLSSAGCTPSIGYAGLPSAGGPDDFVVVASDIVGQASGVLLYGNLKNPPALGGGQQGLIGPSPLRGYYCIVRPQVLGPVSAGGTPGTCEGSFAFPISQATMATLGWTPGSTAYAQFWYADPAHPDGSGIGHTDALEFTVLP